MTTPDRRGELADALAELEARLAAACAAAGRPRDDVTLIAVTKTRPASDVALLHELGVLDVGESKDQEAAAKVAELAIAAPDLRWHFVGRLQRNKVDQVVGVVDVVHSVDRLELAQAIDRQAVRAGVAQRVLLQVNVAGDPAKAGCAPQDLPALLEAVRALGGVRCEGLMTVPAMGADPRPAFRALRTLRDGLGLVHLSMGMSDDFEVAVEEGATIVRVGRAVFGDRRALV